MSFSSMSYSNSSHPLVNQADELMISNMLNALNNPHILKMFDDEELKILLQTVKNHVIIKAKMVNEIQENALAKGYYGTTLNDINRSRN